MQPEVPDIRVRTVSVTDDELIVVFMDGRAISLPLAWFPRLLNGATDALGTGRSKSWHPLARSG